LEWACDAIAATAAAAAAAAAADGKKKQISIRDETVKSNRFASRCDVAADVVTAVNDSPDAFHQHLGLMNHTC